MHNNDLEHLHRAVHLAHDARRAGNLPIGAVITLDGKIVAEGKNTIWAPTLAPNRHVEIEALEALLPGLRARAGEMTLYTTLEPCLMCLGAILVYHIGRVVFGAYDPRGGASCVLGYMPPARGYSKTWSGSGLRCHRRATSLTRRSPRWWRSGSAGWGWISLPSKLMEDDVEYVALGGWPSLSCLAEDGNLASPKGLISTMLGILSQR